MAELIISDLDSFRCQLREHAKHVVANRNKAKKESQTRTILVDTLLTILGYRPSMPTEVQVEYPIAFAHVKTSVDYALLQQGTVEVVVEAKLANSEMGDKEFRQLDSYFSVTTATFGALTNGVEWRWYRRDDGELGKKSLEPKPFLVYDASWDSVPLESEVSWLWGATKLNYDAGQLDDAARTLAEEGRIRDWLITNLSEPSEEFVKFLIGELGFGFKTKATIDRVSEEAKRVFHEFAGQPQRRTPTPSANDQPETETGPDPQVGGPKSTHPNPTSELRLIIRTDDELSVDGGEPLFASKWSRAWRIADGKWHIEPTATKVTTEVLALLLKSDELRDDEERLQARSKLIKYFDSNPQGWVELIPGFKNLYYEKGIPNVAKIDLLREVAGNISFRAQPGSPLAQNPVVEVWMPTVAKN